MRFLFVVSALAFACAGSSASGTAPRSAQSSGALTDPPGPPATAVLEPRSGSQTSGTARFVSSEGGLAAHVEVRGATPGQHGVHIHEKGDCSDPKAASAGGHFNPNSGPHHGGPRTPVRHGGDLGNINVEQNGQGTLDVVVPDLSVNSGQNGVVDRAIVVHEKADDLQTDPAGNSGARVACGRIVAPPAAR